jgi:hypothetical protein
MTFQAPSRGRYDEETYSYVRATVDGWRTRTPDALHPPSCPRLAAGEISRLEPTGSDASTRAATRLGGGAIPPPACGQDRISGPDIDIDP